MKGEMEFIREHVLPAYNMQRLEQDGTSVHLDANTDADVDVDE